MLLHKKYIYNLLNLHEQFAYEPEEFQIYQMIYHSEGTQNFWPLHEQFECEFSIHEKNKMLCHK